MASDLAQTNNGAVKDSLLQVAKALNGPSQNLTALSRSGIQFTEQQKEQIKTLESSLVVARSAAKRHPERDRAQYGGNAEAAAALDLLVQWTRWVKNTVTFRRCWRRDFAQRWFVEAASDLWRKLDQSLIQKSLK